MSAVSAFWLSHFRRHDDNMLSFWNRGDPGLSQDDTIESCDTWPRIEVETVEVVEQAHGVATLDDCPTFDERFVMAREGCYDKTLAIDHGELSLRTGFVIANGFDLAVHQAIVNRGCKHALSTIADSFGVDGFAPAEFRSDGDLAQPFSFAGKQPGCLILVDHQRRSTEPSGRLLDFLPQNRIVDGVKISADGKSRYVAT